MDTIDILRGRFSSAVSSAFEDTDTGSKNLLSSIDRMLSHFLELVWVTGNLYCWNMFNELKTNCRFVTTWPRGMWQSWFHDRPLLWRLKGFEQWTLSQDCRNHRKCREMPPRRVHSKTRRPIYEIYHTPMFLNSQIRVHLCSGWSTIMFDAKEKTNQPVERRLHRGTENSIVWGTAKCILGCKIIKASKWRCEAYFRSCRSHERLPSSSHCPQLRKLIAWKVYAYIVKAGGLSMRPQIYVQPLHELHI